MDRRQPAQSRCCPSTKDEIDEDPPDEVVEVDAAEEVGKEDAAKEAEEGLEDDGESLHHRYDAIERETMGQKRIRKCLQTKDSVVAVVVDHEKEEEEVEEEEERRGGPRQGLDWKLK